MNDKLKDYYKGDEFTAAVWKNKYADEAEETPDDMHMRMAVSFARIRYSKDKTKSLGEWKEYFFQMFKDFKGVIPQGRVMAGLGVDESYRSLSNCLRLPAPKDSYSSIMYVDTMLVSAAKRGCGYGIGMSNLRPSEAKTTNAANTSTGVTTFANRYSNSTHEVGQQGRRGACLEDLDIRHPDSPRWATAKLDKTMITGANISFKIWDDFIQAVKEDKDYLLRWPCNWNEDDLVAWEQYEYDKLEKVVNSHTDELIYLKRVKSKELWDSAIHGVWADGCPGLQFWERIVNYDPASVYTKYQIDGTNACFHPDTLIDTVNGKIRIADIKEETYVYSMDENQRLCIRKASPSFISKINAKTLKIKLQCGSEIQVTPEHKIYIHKKGWVESKDLQIGDRVAHIMRAKRGHKYIGIKLSTQDNRDYVMEHRLVYEGVKGITNFDIHHIDNNSWNNEISNLDAKRHDEHARITALYHNPQNHQIRDNTGRFISTEVKERRTGRNLDDSVSPRLVNQYSNTIESIEEGETIDVYDIQVDDTHCLIANNMVAHNCGEQPKAVFDTCRLLTQNLFGIIDEPFTQNARINVNRLYENSYNQLVLGDDLVDLECIYVQRIIDKVISDPEPMEEKVVELTLWRNVLDMAKSGRRVGCGITGLADMLAALGLKYDSVDALATVELVMKTKMEAELTASIDLAEKYGPFKGWDANLEYHLDETGRPLYGKNDFYQFLLNTFPEIVYRMCKVGRRNVNWSTIAPTGTTSIIAKAINHPNISSGCEPQFGLWYFRNKKVENSNDPYDYIDEIGIKWKTYPVMMGAFKDWIQVNSVKLLAFEGEIDFDHLDESMLQWLFKQSPWYGSTANEIDWKKRVDMQSILQKYTTSAISSTVNFPKDVSEQTISDLYMYAWEKGLKGITCYRDGSKGGVLTNERTTDKFEYRDAIKRPKKLDADLHIVSAKGKKYAVIVGLFQDKPYEIFAFEAPIEVAKVDNLKGEVVKSRKGHYHFVNGKEDHSIKDIQVIAEPGQEQTVTRLASGMLRHRAKPQFVMEQIDKCELKVVEFGSAIKRVLKKYISDNELITRAKCTECNSTDLKMQEGCLVCNSCGSSKCG